MAKKRQAEEVNKSEELRKLFKANPKITLADATKQLGDRGIEIKQSLFYFVKGKVIGRKGRRKKAKQMVAKATATMSSNGAAPVKAGDVIATVLKVKHLASEVGGLRKLKALVEALGE